VDFGQSLLTARVILTHITAMPLGVRGKSAGGTLLALGCNRFFVAFSLRNERTQRWKPVSNFAVFPTRGCFDGAHALVEQYYSLLGSAT
jgi:hypothetical protein